MLPDSVTRQCWVVHISAREHSAISKVSSFEDIYFHLFKNKCTCKLGAMYFKQAKVSLMLTAE